jgi:hypothetical protein
MGETRLRASALLCKIFLQYLTQLSQRQGMHTIGIAAEHLRLEQLLQKREEDALEDDRQVDVGVLECSARSFCSTSRNFRSAKACTP